MPADRLTARPIGVYKRGTMIESIFKLSDSIRYVAIYKNGQLESKSKSNTVGASSSESDRYEELLSTLPYSSWPPSVATSTVAVSTTYSCGTKTFSSSSFLRVGGMCLYALRLTQTQFGLALKLNLWFTAHHDLNQVLHFIVALPPRKMKHVVTLDEINIITSFGEIAKTGRSAK